MTRHAINLNRRRGVLASVLDSALWRPVRGDGGEPEFELTPLGAYASAMEGQTLSSSSAAPMARFLRRAADLIEEPVTLEEKPTYDAEIRRLCREIREHDGTTHMSDLETAGGCANDLFMQSYVIAHVRDGKRVAWVYDPPTDDLEVKVEPDLSKYPYGVDVVDAAIIGYAHTLGLKFDYTFDENPRP